MPSEEWNINHFSTFFYQLFRNLSNAHWQLMYFRCKPRFTDLNANDVLTRHIFLLISIAFFSFLHFSRSINCRGWKWREQRAVETFDMSRNRRRRRKSQDRHSIRLILFISISTRVRQPPPRHFHLLSTLDSFSRPLLSY